MWHEVRRGSLVRQRGAPRSLKSAEGAEIVALNLKYSEDCFLNLIICTSDPIFVCRPQTGVC